jgi:hypothetical protein
MIRSLRDKISKLKTMKTWNYILLLLACAHLSAARNNNTGDGKSTIGH